MSESNKIEELRKKERSEEFRKALCICSSKMSLPLFIIFWFADLVYAPNLKFEFLLLRVLIIPSSLFVNYVCKKEKIGLNLIQSIGIFYSFINSFIITCMILITSGASSPYYAGLNLVALGILAFFPWTKIYLGLSLFVIFFPYYLGVFLQGLNKTQTDNLYLNTFFITGTVMASLVVRKFREDLKLDEIRSRYNLRVKNEELLSVLEQLKSSQAMLVQNEKLAMIGTLSSCLAHELNNSLNRISGGMRTLDRYIESTPENEEKEKVSKVFDIMKKGINMSVDTVNNLRSYSAQERGEVNKINIYTIVNVVLSILKPKISSNIKISLKIAADFEVVGSHAGMNQLFSNLVTNSIDALIDGRGSINITAYFENNFWIIKFGDTGQGIPESNLTKIFDPFFTTKPFGKGTGIGLFIVKKEVERHNGTVNIESSPGKGTTFTFKFPIVK